MSLKLFSGYFVLLCERKSTRSCLNENFNNEQNDWSFFFVLFRFQRKRGHQTQRIELNRLPTTNPNRINVMFVRTFCLVFSLLKTVDRNCYNSFDDQHIDLWAFVVYLRVKVFRQSKKSNSMLKSQLENSNANERQLWVWVGFWARSYEMEREREGVCECLFVCCFG